MVSKVLERRISIQLVVVVCKDIQSLPKGYVVNQLPVDSAAMPFLGERPGVVIGTTFLRWIFNHSKHFECFSYELTTEELSVLFNFTLLFPVEISFRTVFEQYFSGFEPILVADRVPPKLIEVI